MNRDELVLRAEAAKAGDDRITEVCQQQEERFEKPRPGLKLQKGWLNEAEIRAEQDANLEQLDKAFQWLVNETDKDHLMLERLRSDGISD